MAEVSALVACHWAAAWIREELPALDRDMFAPFGFTPTPGQTFGWPELFVPVAPFGYLRYVPPEERDDDGLAFEVDDAVMEGDDDAGNRLAKAARRHGAALADGRCRCQLCAPEFAPLT
jgi:hypothetical protein